MLRRSQWICVRTLEIVFIHSCAEAELSLGLVVSPLTELGVVIISALSRR